jgi:hypothetical protein
VLAVRTTYSLLAFIVGWSVAVPSALARPARTPGGPFLLVALPALGTVTWRCDTHDPARSDRRALGFRAFKDAATEAITLRVAGRAVAVHRLDPGRSVVFPWVRQRLLELDISQPTEPGTLRATVKVDFVPHRTYSYCWPYLPPRIDVRLLPR